MLGGEKLSYVKYLLSTYHCKQLDSLGFGSVGWWTRSTAAKSFSSAMIVGFGSGKDLRDYWEDFNLGQGLSIHTVYISLSKNPEFYNTNWQK